MIRMRLIGILVLIGLLAAACGAGATSTPPPPTSTPTVAAALPTATQPAPTATTPAGAPTAVATATSPPSPTSTPTAAATQPPPTPTPTATATPTPQPTSISESMEASAEIEGFTHQNLVVQVGTTVTWTQRDGAPHTTTSGEPGNLTGIWDSGPLGQEQTFGHTFDQVGAFPYFCAIHPSMRATITVVESMDEAATPASADSGAVQY